MRNRLAVPAFAAAVFLASCSSKDGGTTDPVAKIASKTRVSKQSAGDLNRSRQTAHKYVFNRPEHVKGIYLTAWSAGSRAMRERLLDMVDRTELNSVVIDVRDEGRMFFKTGIALADESHALKLAVARPDALFESLEKHKIWPIARIACFRDDFVPIQHPELAVQLKNGKIWKDRAHNSWLDPYNQKNWDYLAQTVEYALDLGFPEIQLDYVRFPSEGKSSTQVFPAKKAYASKATLNEDVISAFARFIGDKVHARKAIFSADIFGIISSTKGDEGIGQQLEKVAAPFDVLSPMVYPSHFARGEYGVKDPNRSPYDIVLKSLSDFKKRLPKVTVRPWLQDFSLAGVHYGAAEVQDQIRAAREVGYDGFLVWNSKSKYDESAFQVKGGQ